MRVKLKDITKFSKGTQINGKNLIDDGAYSYLNGGINPSGKWNEFNVAENTVTISEGGNSSGYVNYMNEAFWCGAHCYYLYDGPKNSKYLYYALKSQQERLFRIRSGACMPNIKKSDLGNFIIEYEKDEVRQEEVVKVLEKCELLIEDYNKKLALLDEAVRARFVEMFGDLESNSMNWEKSLLANKLNVVGGYAFKSSEFNECEGIPVLRIGNINSGYFKPVNMVYWKENPRLSKYEVYPGDLVMSLTGTVGKDDYGNVCILGNEYEMYYLNQRNAKLEIVNGLNKYYLTQLLKFSCIKDKLTGINRGVRQANISNKDILDLVVPVPPLELQNQFASFVQEIDKSRSRIQKSLEASQELFDSLMQDYFG